MKNHHMHNYFRRMHELNGECKRIHGLLGECMNYSENDIIRFEY